MSREVQIIFQSNDFVAVNKDAGVSVHNNEDPENLLLLLEKQLKILKFFPVHRLDKETSGIQILALNEIAARKLADEFQNKSVEKIYTGVLRGQMKDPQGVWNQSLTDKAEGRKSPAGSARDRMACETRFKVLKSSKYFSFCEFHLITGRQHQIRKHSALVNHPLVGDNRYGEPKYNQRMAELYKTPRMFLHCHKLQILGQKLESPLPGEFHNLSL
jgi:RluA family pseudouridine synthase